jgi:hypothetical protein
MTDPPLHSAAPPKTMLVPTTSRVIDAPGNAHARIDNGPAPFRRIDGCDADKANVLSKHLPRVVGSLEVLPGKPPSAQGGERIETPCRRRSSPPSFPEIQPDPPVDCTVLKGRGIFS